MATTTGIPSPDPGLTSNTHSSATSIHSEDDEVKDLDHDPLQHSSYHGPVSDQDLRLDEAVTQKIQLEIPAMRPFIQIGGKDNAVLARRDHALKKGACMLGKEHLLEAEPASRRLYHEVFMKELGLLETMLTLLERTQFKEGEAFSYRILENNYWVLNRILKQIGDTAKRSFDFAGLPLPPIPSWGNKNIFNFFEA